MTGVGWQWRWQLKFKFEIEWLVTEKKSGLRCAGIFLQLDGQVAAKCIWEQSRRCHFSYLFLNNKTAKARTGSLSGVRQTMNRKKNENYRIARHFPSCSTFRFADRPLRHCRIRTNTPGRAWKKAALSLSKSMSTHAAKGTTAENGFSLTGGCHSTMIAARSDALGSQEASRPFVYHFFYFLSFFVELKDYNSISRRRTFQFDRWRRVTFAFWLNGFGAKWNGRQLRNPPEDSTTCSR